VPESIEKKIKGGEVVWLEPGNQKKGRKEGDKDRIITLLQEPGDRARR